MILLIKLLIKTKWRGVFQMYLIDFKQKEGSLTNYPSLSAILEKNPLFSTGSFCFCRQFKNLLLIKLLIKSLPASLFEKLLPHRKVSR